MTKLLVESCMICFGSGGLFGIAVTEHYPLGARIVLAFAAALALIGWFVPLALT